MALAVAEAMRYLVDVHSQQDPLGWYEVPDSDRVVQAVADRELTSGLREAQRQEVAHERQIGDRDRLHPFPTPNPQAQQPVATTTVAADDISLATAGDPNLDEIAEVALPLFEVSVGLTAIGIRNLWWLVPDAVALGISAAERGPDRDCVVACT